MKATFQSGFIALAIMALTVPAYAEPLEDGVAAFQSGDYATALRLWRQLAGQGNAKAQYNLGLVYTKGQGVPRDFAAAYMWFTLAAAQGDEQAHKARGSLAKRMTHGQIEEAALLVREWRREHPR